MHLLGITIKNIRSLHSHKWSIPKDTCAGWHVILGDNGSGKSSFLRAIALALTGPDNAQGLRLNWDDWLTRSQPKGEVLLKLTRNPDCDPIEGKGKNSRTQTLQTGVQLSRSGKSKDRVEMSPAKTGSNLSRFAHEADQGWFSASYGPFRRFSGSDPQLERSFSSMPGLARHLSIFEERVALTESLEWLRDLKFRALENDPEGALLSHLMEFINQSEFLPAGVQLEEVTSRDIMFRDANGVDVSIGDLSDGYRSILSMTFELIRQIAIAFGPEHVFDAKDSTKIIPEGIVIIDEIDAHLHPTWQRRIGRWFCEHFPNIQFIVSTHSPLVCQSAENGSIYLLPRAGSDEKGGMLEGEALHRLIYGTVLDAYGTEAFGSEAALTRSPKSRDLHKRLAALNNKEILKGLSAKEKKEQQELRGMLPSAASLFEQAREAVGF